MIGLVERSAERDAVIRATLPHVPFDGWTARALGAGLADLGLPPELGRNLFPDGPVGLVEAWGDLADREMEAAVKGMATEMTGLGVTGRVRAVIAIRLRQRRPDREAVRRALALFGRARQAPAAARMTARTVDAIWHAVGDHATDFSWYTKRASLAAIYGATLLYWLGDASEDEAATLAFLDRRLAGLAAIGGLRRRLTGACARRLPWRTAA